jgi:glutamyl-tRNA reductase
MPRNRSRGGVLSPLAGADELDRRRVVSILLIGLNHRTAPVEVREQLAFSREGVATALLLFRNRFPQSEAAILSTCNRVEMLVASDGDRPNVADVLSFIAQARDLPVGSFKPYLYQLEDEQACRHFFRVASGLDSMVLGESQIVNQVKQAFAAASEQGTTGRTLNRMFHHAFEVSKRVRSETKIGQGHVSIPSVAVDIAGRIFDDFSSKRALVIGAGEMAQLVCTHLRDADVRQFVVCTRSMKNAKSLADAFDAIAVPFDQLDAQLAEADIVIAATACPLPFLTADRVAAAQKKRGGRLLFIIDLAVPRNVEPAVASVSQTYVYDVDALGRAAADNQQQRVAQLAGAERILDEEVTAFTRWLDQTKLNPLIERMYRDAHDVSEVELNRLLRRCPDLTDEQREAIEQFVDRLVGKFMHPYVTVLRRQQRSDSGVFLAGAFRSAAAAASAAGATISSQTNETRRVL